MRTANQGVLPWTLITAVGNLLQLTTQLDARHVRLWYGPSRPQLSGADEFVWYRFTQNVLDESPGPQEYGNKYTMMMDIHYAVRSFQDEAQVDERRAVLYHVTEMKIMNAFQNRNLWSIYSLPAPGGPWQQPVPAPRLAPLTVTTMLLKSVPVPDKTQKEEGTIESAWQLSVPSVLPLNIP